MIDWFTVLAEIANFLVLVIVLRYLLYKRIIDVMDRRRESIAQRLRDAEEKKNQAESREESLRLKQQELDSRREGIISDAENVAEERKKSLLERANKDVSEAESRWMRAARKKRNAFIFDFRRQVVERVVETSRRVCRDLADEDFEQRVVTVLLKRLEKLRADGDPDLRVVLFGRSDEPLIVKSGFSLSEESREKIEAALEQEIDSKRTRFVEDRSILGGIEVVSGEYKIGWSVGDYLDDLSEEMDAALSRPTHAEEAK